MADSQENKSSEEKLQTGAETGLALNDFKFSKDEIEGEMGSSAGGYNKEYSYFLKASPGTKHFEVIDNATEEVLYTADHIDCIMYYGHNVYKLLAGHIKGLSGDKRKWGTSPEGVFDEDLNKELTKVVAISYNSPFSKKNASRGNFDRNNYGEWLDSTSKRQFLEKRQCVILLMPDLINSGVLQPKAILGSFGGSSIIPFSTFKKSVDGLGLPLMVTRTTIGFQAAKNKTDDDYNQVVFSYKKGDNGSPLLNDVFKDSEDVRKGNFGIPLRKKIEELHLDYVGKAENGELAMGPLEDDIVDVTHSSAAINNPASGPEASGAEPFSDDIPF